MQVRCRRPGHGLAPYGARRRDQSVRFRTGAVQLRTVSGVAGDSPAHANPATADAPRRAGRTWPRQRMYPPGEAPGRIVVLRYKDSDALNITVLAGASIELNDSGQRQQ